MLHEFEWFYSTVLAEQLSRPRLRPVFGRASCRYAPRPAATNTVTLAPPKYIGFPLLTHILPTGQQHRTWFCQISSTARCWRHSPRSSSGRRPAVSSRVEGDQALGDFHPASHASVRTFAERALT